MRLLAKTKKTINGAAHSLDMYILERATLIMAIRVVEFSNGGYKIRKVFA